MSTTDELKSYASAQAIANGIPPGIFLNLISAESSWNPNAVSGKGAEGIAQLEPGTAPNINRFDPFASLSKAAQLLRSYFDKFGSWPLAVAAYNAGPNNAAIKAGEIPNIPETQNYVQKILGAPFSLSFSGGVPVQGSTKIIFWASAAILGVIILGSVVKT